MGSVRLMIFRLALAGFGLLAPGASASAQAGSRLALSVAAGPSPYDLSGTGTGFAAAMELSWRPVSGLVIEPGLTYFTYESQFSERIHYLMNELSVQGELTLRRVRPFVGGGAGFARVVSDPEELVATLHAVGGLRVDLSQGWGARAEMRVRQRGSPVTSRESSVASHRERAPARAAIPQRHRLRRWIASEASPPRNDSTTYPALTGD